MKKVIIFGSGSTGKRVYEKIKAKVEVKCFTDNDPSKWGATINEVQIKPPSELSEMDFDFIYIASLPGLELIYEQLLNEYHIPVQKIVRKEVDLPVMARVRFLESFAEYAYSHNISGAVCEVGVFQGEFAKEINAAFPDRTCYLFDTFEGFDERDIAIERAHRFTEESAGHLSITNVDMVLEKMPHPEKCVIKKGYFPETFDVEHESFCFVNLDTDLYKPTMDALEILHPLMFRGGIILIHDYFNKSYGGVKAAVDEFVAKKGQSLSPIGDGFSVVVL